MKLTCLACKGEGAFLSEHAHADLDTHIPCETCNMEGFILEEDLRGIDWYKFAPTRSIRGHDILNEYITIYKTLHDEEPEVRK